MEGFKYIDIFATKGIEYIIVLTFLGILVLFWRWMSKYGKVEIVKQKVQKGISLIDWFSLKNDYFYHQGHTWVAPENKNVVLVGVDDFTQKFLGKPSKISVPEVGSELRQGEKGFQFQFDTKTILLLHQAYFGQYNRHPNPGANKMNLEKHQD